MKSKKDLTALELEKNENEKKLLIDNNERKKAQLINELKCGLGSEIMKNPSKVKIIKKTKSEKLMMWLKSIFTKF